MEAGRPEREPGPPALVPELLVGSLQASLAFWRDLCGFEVRYDRKEEGFAYLFGYGAHLMLEEAGIGRNWLTGPLDRPLGRGINLQIAVPRIDHVVQRLEQAGWPLFMRPEVKWYRTGETRAGVTQFLVQDPDGYLVRFQASFEG
ncbi:MAG: bleomycin resistance protein, partial [Candidatus Dormibacteraceae bacterium]